MGAASFAAWGYTSHGFSLLVEARNLTVDTLANLAKAARAVAAAVGGLASAAGEAFKKVIKDEKISPVVLVLCLITGALQVCNSIDIFPPWDRNCGTPCMSQSRSQVMSDIRRHI